MRSFDVVVVGGGIAGLAAAVTAARSGARTALIERGGVIGGMVSRAFVHTICGLYRQRAEVSHPLQFANEGFPREFIGRLVALGAASGPVRMGRMDVMLLRPSDFGIVADDVTTEVPSLEVFFHSGVVAVHVKEEGLRRIHSVGVQCRGKQETIAGKVFVDATGDAELAALSGALIQSDGTLQRPAYIIQLCRVDVQMVSNDKRLPLAGRICSAVADGELPASALGASFRPGLLGDVWVTIDLQADPYDPLASASLTHVEREGRKTARELTNFLRHHVAGFENACIAALPTQAGIRESRRIVGRAHLIADSILNPKENTEAVAWASWPLELRESAKGPKFRYSSENRPAPIPAGCLQAEAFSNLLAAGRCISCSHEAQASIRVTGTCLATGQAAGRLAIQVATMKAP